jgi:ABC-2 type transport system permease protein
MTRFATGRFLVALVATNLKACFALRGAVWAQTVFMALNNAVFFVVWWIFFERFEEIRGWRLNEMAALFGIAATAYGLAVVFAGGVSDLARKVIEGEIDALLTQPKNVLLHSAGSRSYASGWGDVVSGCLFIAFSGLARLELLPALVVAIAASTTVFVACGILFHSAVFWLGRVENLTRQLWEFLVTFSLYPRPLFTGALKLLLFTALPAGFISYLPVELLQGGSWRVLLWVVLGALFYACVAAAVFSLGLRRYESGNRFGVRA